MINYTAVVIGGTGLIGSSLVNQLLNNNQYDKVIIIARRWNDQHHPKMEVIIVNFEDKNELVQKFPLGSHIFCCIGTTQKKVSGNKEAYRRIDFDIPYTIAKLGIEKGYSQYLLVSAAGANSTSSNFYLNLKGTLEDALCKLSFQSIHLFRPSVLLGKRKENRWGERLAKFFVIAFSFMLRGKMTKYKAIHSKKVAHAMLTAATKNKNGQFIYHYDEMITMNE